MTLKTVNSIAAIVVAAFLAVGCNNFVGKPATDNTNSKGLSGFSSASALSEDESHWRCPHEANVVLKDNIGTNGYDYSGRNDYTVCVSRDSVKSFRVHPTLPTSRAICIYPLYARSSGQITLLEQPRCFTLNGNTSPFNVAFNSNSINQFAIVDMNFSDQMNACLSGPAACPAYSVGFVQ